jgi:hypothetical protein
MHPSNNNCHKKKNPTKKKKKKQTKQNKTHQKKKQKQNKTKKQRSRHCLDRQINRHVALIYKIYVYAPQNDTI